MVPMSPEHGHEVSRHWRLRRQRYSLVGEVCPHCETKIFPPRDICPDCGNEASQEFQFSGKGTIYTFSEVREAPAGHEQNAPYHAAIVQLEEGPKVTSQLTDLGDIRPEIGMPVEMVTRKIGEAGG